MHLITSMAGHKFWKQFLILTTITATALCCHETPVWGYECSNGKCIKVPFKNEYSSPSLSVCSMLCGEEIGTLWPKPTGSVKIGDYVHQIRTSNISFLTTFTDPLWERVESRFRAQLEAKIPDSELAIKSGSPLVIRIHLECSLNEIPMFTYETDESYSLKTMATNNTVYAHIRAKTFFGARHGLETLSQLIVYDDVIEIVQILIDTEINDAPAYKHRGLLLDTGRHYFSVKSIKRIMDGMAMSKLNSFHWHIVDSNSFPLVVASHPDLHRLGAYSPLKIYTPKDIHEVVEYALVRGIRVIPEFGGPAHIGEGWQTENVTVCFKAQPWSSFCAQPPCGQLDPTKVEMYSILGDIYSEMFESFKPNIFHMGGDTVSIPCWKSSKAIQDWIRAKGLTLETNSFLKLWGHFHTNALDQIDKVSKDKEVPIILWASKLTTVPFIDEYLTSKSRYIIQTVADNSQRSTRNILNRGFRIIFTSLDLIVNGGTANYMNRTGTQGWRKFYTLRPDRASGRSINLILGSEAAIWSEQIDEFSLDGQLWPKASALAERLWSNPSDGWRKAERRLLIHRELLMQSGIAAEAVKPEWCFQNPSECLI